MKITIKSTIDIGEPDCSSCEHLKTTYFSDDAYGATKTFKETECTCNDKTIDCPFVESKIEGIHVIDDKCIYQDFELKGVE